MTPLIFKFYFFFILAFSNILADSIFLVCVSGAVTVFLAFSILADSIFLVCVSGAVTVFLNAS
jgi:hypothetical protein